MRRPVFAPLPLRIISSSVNSVPSNITTSAFSSRAGSAGVDQRRRPERTRGGAAGAQFDADIGAAFFRQFRHVRLAPFEIERHLAGRGEQLDLDAGRFERPVERDRRALDNVGRQHGEDGVVGDNRQRFGAAVDRERLALAHIQAAPRPGRLPRRSAPPPRSGCRARLACLPRTPCRSDAAAGVAAIWARRSGEALSSTQFSPSFDTARLACVRARTRLSPCQASRQTGQRQFHCG